MVKSLKKLLLNYYKHNSALTMISWCKLDTSNRFYGLIGVANTYSLYDQLVCFVKTLFRVEHDKSVALLKFYS